MITTAGKFRLVIFGSRVQLSLMHRLQNRLERGDGREERGVTPLTCYVGWQSSGQWPPTDPLGEAHKVDICPVYIYYLLLLRAGNIYTNYSAADLDGMGQNQDSDPGFKQFLR